MQNSAFTRNVRNGYVWLLFIALLACPLLAQPQSFDLPASKKRATLPFRIVRNMVVVPLTINNRGPYNFILDTGVGLMLITDPKLVDSIGLQSKRTIKIFGLNGENYEAYVTPTLKVNMPNISSTDVAAAIFKDDHFGLSHYAGMPIHGLLGYEFFSNLAVRFNFYDSTLVISKPQNVRLLRKGIKIPLTVEDKKPYIITNVKTADGKTLPRKLLIDIGAGHPLSLENMLRDQGLPQNFIMANLGIGLTGPVNGFISRVNEINLGSYKLKDVITSFPDQDSLTKLLPTIPRDGSLGIGLLKRFTMIIDYTNGALYLKKGLNFSDPFEHDMTGMEYYYDNIDYSHLLIGRVEPGSAADDAHLLPYDEILAINFKPIEKMGIDQIENLFRSRTGRNLLLEINRNKQILRVLLTLKKRI